MSDTETAGLPETEPSSLDSIIDKAISAAETPSTDGESASAPETASLSDDRPRDEKGRFVAKEGDSHAEAPSSPAKGATDAPAQAAPVAQPDPAQSAPIEAPRNFTAEQKATFAALPRPVQEQVVAVEKAREAEYTRRSQEFAEFKRTAEPLVQALQPFQEYLTKIAPATGMQPHQLVSSILAAEYNLRTGSPEQKYAAFAHLAQQYGVDLGALSRGEVAMPDPTITQLRQQLSDLQQWKAVQEQTFQQHQQEQVSSAIQAFESAKDESGKPKYPYFQAVKGTMGQIMAEGKAQTLEDAYAQAVAPIMADLSAAMQKQTQLEESQKQARLAKAEKAAPVRSSGNQPGGQVVKGLDAHISRALEAAGLN